MLRQQHRPSTKAVRNTETQITASLQKSEVLASYLSNTVWKTSFLAPITGPPFFPKNADLGPLKPWELDAALRRAKPRRSSGPDGVPSEWYKHAPAIFQTLLLSHFTQAFLRAESADYWRIACLGMIFKVDPKTPSLPHRPICLANTIHKTDASMLHLRISSAVGHLLPNQNFGFRQARSLHLDSHFSR